MADSDGRSLGLRSDSVQKQTPFVPAYDPDSPFADDDGLIGVPNVNLAEEAVNLSLAKNTYKANLKTIEAAGELQDELLKILDKDV